MAAVRYVFEPDGVLRIKSATKADPQKIGEALAIVAEKHGGQIKPPAVVEAARSPRSPLHRHFDWVDGIAAGKWRLEQARDIIRSIRVDDATSEPPRAFLSVNQKSGVAYHTLGAVLASANLQNAVLAAAERDLEAFERRYKELTDVCRLIAEARAAVRRRRTEQESRVGAT